MPSVQHNRNADMILRGMPRGGIAKWSTVRRYLEKIVHALPVGISVDGADVSTTGSGLSLLQKHDSYLAAQGYVRTRDQAFNILPDLPGEIIMVKDESQHFSLSLWATVGTGVISYGWTKNGSPFQLGPAVGVSAGIQVSDSGLYVGTATDDKGNSASIEFTLTVLPDE